ncbi:DNA replication and repair protein RecF [Salana multivorans]|uniref:DNA replication and repair protein RecF n=1 Tax=Salana multivorans TaxID=120377 RepID=A0A3N2DAB8_9MICO|nr:DNA replication/repair protein RecF [Salana multivorans]ROR96673.1 DNA replication and repair protein RecF [Salana multivorans]
MYVSDLALTDFRSYPEVVVSMPPGITAFVGPNGQGKTNLVEAVSYLASFTSHRVASDAPLLRQGATKALVRARVHHGDRPRIVEVEINAGRANKARVDRAPVQRIRDAAGIVRCVVFAPEDLALVKGDPDVRRRFLDDLVVQRSPRLAAVRSDYERVLRQRTQLLKSAGAFRGGRRRGSSDPDATDTGETSSSLRTLDVWDAQLAEAGSQLVAARVALVRELRGRVGDAYEEVSSAQGELRLAYRASLSRVRPEDAIDDADGDDASALAEEEELLRPELVEARMLEAMIRLRPRELERGLCLVGPHRDDLTLTLAGLPVKGYASHGESWSVALALRLASFGLLRDDPDWEGGDPILVLDDVFAELDARRRRKLSALVAGAEQVLLTAAVVEDVPEELDGARFDVMGGEVTRVR